MKRSNTSALVALATAALMGAANPVHAATPTRVAAKAAAPAKHSARATRPETKRAPKPSSTPATPTTSAPTANAAPSVICFQSSVRCFAAVRAPGTPSTAAIDLHPPDLRKIFPASELEKRLPEPDEQLAAQEAATVEVSTERVAPPPNVPVGILAPFWAIRHPTQAWRIFMPVPEGK